MIDIEIGLVRSDLTLRVPATEDSLPVVRQALRSVGQTVDADVDALEDAELAVTEALANAVEHAYGGGEGEIRVLVRPEESSLLVTVSDDGKGMPPEIRRRSEGRGYGLSMIEGIASSLEIAGGDGTDVHMTFPMGRPMAETVDGAVPGVEPTERMLRRLVAVVAAQRDMPSDRLVEALLVAELVARNALRYLIGDRAQLSIAPVEGGFELRVGPLESGGAEAAVSDSDVPVVGSVIAQLADSTDTEPTNGDERLVVRIS
jgi:serine/threonine-protein kinase RsbW